MKKLTAIFLLLSFLLCSCKKNISNASSDYCFETDYQYQYYDQTVFISNHLAEAPKGYYYISKENLLRFIDKETMEDIIVCGKPDCLHDTSAELTVEDREKCNAYMKTTYFYLHYYEDYLYYTSSEYDERRGFYSALTRISLDGSQRKIVWDYTWPEKYSGSTIYLHLFHRGKIYFILYQGVGTEEGKSAYLISYDLSSKKLEELYRYDADETYLASSLQVIGNAMYWHNIVSSDFQAMEVVRFDLSTRDITVYEDCQDFFCGGDRIYIQQMSPSEDINYAKFHCIDKEGNDQGVLEITGDLYSIFKMDEKYIYNYDRPATEESGILVYSKETQEKVAFLPYPDGFLKLDFSVIPVNGKVLLYDVPHEKTYYAKIDAIGTPDFQWYEVEKVN